MVIHMLTCPHCDSLDVIRHGKDPNGVQRYRCRVPPPAF
jgi:transposase-like protein